MFYLEYEFPTDICIPFERYRAGLKARAIGTITFIKRLSPMVSRFKHATTLYTK